MTLFEIIELLVAKVVGGRQLPFKVDKATGQTPLHYAFKSGKLEMALWLMQIVRRDQGQELY